MAIQPSPGAGGALERQESSSLADVVNTILDKGLVIDVYARVSLVGIELLRADARIVIASVDTYLRFAEAVNRLELSSSEPAGLPEVVDQASESGSKSKTKGALEAGAEKLEEVIEPDDQEKEKEGAKRPRREGKESRS